MKTIYKRNSIYKHGWEIKLTQIMLFFSIISLASCTKFLDLKPDKKMVIPASLTDCQALLDNYITMNTGHCTSEAVADNYYLTYADWNTLEVTRRDGYVWKTDADVNSANWSTDYQQVLYANEVLQTLDKITPLTSEQQTWNTLRGQALFFRSFSFYLVAQLFTKPYDATTATTDLGIPLRLTPDISVISERGTVKQTYDRILQDFKEAAALLPVDQPSTIINKTRPTKAAALAMLARTYLAMGDYVNAGLNADACLQNYSTLIDFNTLTTTASYPVARFGLEVIFQATASGWPNLLQSKAKIDSTLYSSYLPNDLRKTVFFKANAGTTTYQFKGSYDASNSQSQFCGPSTDEVYLIRAESFARAGNTASAMSDLNTLLRKRWKTGTYTDMTATDANDALAKVLTERRKELLFRSLRWTDLRRLNKESRFAVTLKRTLNGQDYTLAPNDLRYVLLIPQEVLNREPMPQNPR